MQKIVSLTTIAMLMSSAFAANAASTGTINFNGKVTDTTCDVAINGQEGDATVTLPTVPATELASAGKTTGLTNFNMTLKNCVLGSEGENTVAAFFQTGATVDNESGRLKQTSAAGAENVSLQLLDGTNGNTIFVGNQNQEGTNYFANVKEGEAIKLPYSVRYYAEDAVTSGVVTSSVVYNLQYK
ncbi:MULTISPECIES: fimbrial protein [unclassified Serratia (in: enterobacteria)]|uniref:fimbrial protein n=1 Tax=unclassified Serratia (in: enterobacteria) TaxID=2647522 RepID=UPI000508302A|nr:MULTISPECIES: fimbrial protein [unclassified Serratia (in: enterobacteria)]KFK93401.1 fimbrial protein [Serratia sp. Ag2]KFK97045.1 fimbrial protein [Serratia sp. Ag1]